MSGMSLSKLPVPLLLLWFVSMTSLAAQPVITGVSIPNTSMKINDVVTATISVESDSAEYALTDGHIGHYTLVSLVKVNDTTYTATFTITEGGIDYAAGDDIPTYVMLTDVDMKLKDEWTTPIVQANDPIGANRPTVTSILRETPTSEYTNADTVIFRVAFDENVQNVDTSDFVLSGAASGTVNAVLVMAPDNEYSVRITGVSGNGELDLNIANGNDVQDVLGNPLGNSPAIGSEETYTIDTIDPIDPTPSSSSHTVSVWDNDDTVDIQVSGASDPGGSGVDGFEYEWDQNATWTPTETKEVEETWTGATFTATPNGDWYFHITTVDNAGNWTSTEHLGPFQIDTIPPSVPTNLSPTSGTYTNDMPPTLSWNASTDTGGSGMRTTATYRYVVTGGSSGYTENLEYKPTLDEGAYTWKIRSRDNAGNNGGYTSDYTLTIDRTDPIDPTPSSSSHTVGVWSNDATVDIDIAGASDPVSNGVQSGVDGFDYAWDKNATWTATEVKDQEESWSSGTFTATSDGDWYFHIATVDNAGNWTSTEHLGPFQIDTDPPAVSDVTVSDTLICDADTPGTATFEVTVEFDEVMDTGVDPTLTFSPGVATTLTLNAGQSGWTDNDTYVAKYDVADAGVDVDIVTIDVTGAQDPAGNGQEDYTPVHEFEIDTLNPTVGIVVSDQAIHDGDVGVDAFTVTATYSEVMDPATIPTLTFTPNPAATLTNRSGVWSGGNTVYTWTTDIEDAGVEIDDINVTVFGGKDVAGNDQVSNTLTDHIDIDTLNPTISSITSSTSDGCYNVGANINVTVNFSEEVTLTGGTLDVTLDAPDVVGITAFGPATSASTTYSVGAGDNSCDLDATNVVLDGGTLRDNAGNDAVIALPATTIADGSNIVVDTTDPVINPIANDKTVECDGAGNNGELNTWLNSHGGASATDNCGGVTWTNDFTGLSDDCGETGSALVTFTATDDCGLSSTTQATFTIEDTTNPVIVWDIDLPASPQYVDPLLCTIAFPIQATVTDNCCIPAQNVSVDISVSSNATLLHGVTVTQVGDTVVVAGIITVSNLTGCPAVLSVAINATDCCENDAVQLTDSVEIYDNTVPVINDLVVDDHVLVSADCCETTVNFAANVTENCCIIPDNVAVTVTLPTDNAILGNIVVNRVQNGQGRVDITGSTDIRCLTSCPAQVEVHIEAIDCCGNDAVPVTSTATEGRVYDETAPEPQDDPNGDEDRSTSDNLEVRSDDYGQHRLMVRGDTTVRIDVVYSDSDNCSTCTCEKHLWIDDIVTPSGYGTATIEDSESSVSDPGTAIRYAPYHGYYGKDEFTYRIVDACGNVSQEASVFIEVIAQTVMEDVCLTTCVDTAVSFDVTATDLWIDPDNPGEIPFVFSIVTPPMHGVISGDLGAVTYATHGGIESATITLIYTPAAGFVGRDVLTLRFADPFGGSSTAMVDIAVIECAEQPGAPPLFILQQGEIFPLIVPLTFAVVYEAAWETVTLIAETDGAVYQGTLSATWEESINRYVLKLDTAALPPGLYRMTIPLGNGETVTLMIQVGEAE